MYKKILFVASIVAGLTSCNEDYKDWQLPEQNAQAEIKTVKLVINPAFQALDLDTVKSNRVAVVTFDEMPNATFVNGTFNAVNGDKQYSMPIDAAGTVATADLKSAVAVLYNRDRAERAITGNVAATVQTKQTEVQTNALTVHLKSEGPVNFNVWYPNTPSYYFFTGNTNNWSTEANVPFFPTLEDKNVQTLTTYFWSAWDGKFWFQDNVGNWGEAYTAGDDTNRTGHGTITQYNDLCFFSPAEGMYTMTINMNDMTYSFTECEDQFPAEYDAIGIIGLNGDWNTDVDMSQVIGKDDAKTHVWYAYNVAVNQTCECKFRVNHDWATSWGNSGDLPYGVASEGSNNISGVEPGTYDVYFNDITKQYIFIAK